MKGFLVLNKEYESIPASIDLSQMQNNAPLRDYVNWWLSSI